MARARVQTSALPRDPALEARELGDEEPEGAAGGRLGSRRPGGPPDVIVPRFGEGIDGTLRRFRRACDNAGTLKALALRTLYPNRGRRRRAKAQRALKRLRSRQAAQEA